MRTLFLVFFLFSSLFLPAQEADVFRIDSLPASGVLLDKSWKFHAGDNPEWAKAEFDDRDWEGIDPTKTIHYLPQIRKKPVGWFRIRLKIDSSLLNKPLAFYIFQSLASEIFLDGKELNRYGVVSQNQKEIKAIQPLNSPAGLLFDKSEQTLAVRFSVQPNLYYSNFVIPFTTFQMRINDVNGAGQFNRIGNKFPVLNAIYTGGFLVLTIIHLGLFFIYKKQKANLFFSLAMFSGVVANGFFITIILSNDVAYRSFGGAIEYLFLFTFYHVPIYAAIYYLFSQPRTKIYWAVLIYSLLSVVFWFITYENSILLAFFLPFFFCMFDLLRLALKAHKRKFKDAMIIIMGLVGYLIFYFAFYLVMEGFVSDRTIGFGNTFILTDALYHASVICLPVAISFYLSRDFAFTSVILEKKITEIQHLSAEKQHILASQNELLEKQVAARTAELKASQNQLIQKEKLASLGELTAGIAHEIQNPLNFVNNFSELSVGLANELKEEIDKVEMPEKDKEYIGEILGDLTLNQGKINHHGKRASGIVKAMLEHSRSSKGERQLTDINVLCDEYLRLSFHGLKAKDKSFNADYQLNLDETIEKINVVPQDIGRVLLNLINNAFYAVNQRKSNNPTVLVSTKRLENGIEIRVKDNGNGIPENIKSKIFQPFFTTKPTGEGTGLGLSLTYDIVTKGYEGSLEVVSKEGEGSEFVVQLPRE